MMENPSKLARHWEFALGQAFWALEQLILNFDFAARSNGTAYAGVPTPSELTVIVEGFLNEQSILYGGDITRLKRLLETVEKSISPVYQAGKEAAHQQWQQATDNEHKTFLELSLEEIFDRAQSLATQTASSNEQNWFIEGFCRQWHETEFVQYVLKSE